MCVVMLWTGECCARGRVCVSMLGTGVCCCAVDGCLLLC